MQPVRSFKSRILVKPDTVIIPLSYLQHDCAERGLLLLAIPMKQHHSIKEPSAGNGNKNKRVVLIPSASLTVVFTIEVEFSIVLFQIIAEK